MKKLEIIQKEFKGNVAVSISNHEVRVWVCDLNTGQNVFRFKATGSVYNSGSDITVLANQMNRGEQSE